MHKFQSIDQLHQMIRYARAVARGDIRGKSIIDEPVPFIGTVKIHGANAGVVIDVNDNIVLQSRNRIVTLSDDNHGFARWMHDDPRRSEWLKNLRSLYSLNTAKLAVFGEWCGPGIQNGVAVNKLPTRQWVIFAVYSISDTDVREKLDISCIQSNPQLDIYNITDVATSNITIDFSNDVDIGDKAELMEKLTDEIDAKCPWAMQWNIEGTGEGIVWSACGKFKDDENLVFKTKGKTHRVVEKKLSNASHIDPIVIKNVSIFVDYAVTENRLLQGIEWLKEMGKPLEMSSIPHFLKWVADDVQKECKLELSDSGLAWAQVVKNINNKSLNFYKQFLVNNSLKM